MKQFKKHTIEEFNNVFGTDLKLKNTFCKAIDNIEKEGVNYFYVSGFPKDVEEAIEDEKEIAELLDLKLIEITDIGLFIAIY